MIRKRFVALEKTILNKIEKASLTASRLSLASITISIIAFVLVVFHVCK